MEKENPQESNDLYSIYQQNVHQFFNEFFKSISQYQQSMTNLQLECIKSCGIMLNPALAFNQNFENKSTVITPLKITSPAQQTKIEEPVATNSLTIENQNPYKLHPLKFSSIISNQEIRPSQATSKKTLDGETFWKNQYALKRGKLPTRVIVQDEKIKIFANKHSQDLSFMTKDGIVKGECQNCGKLLEDPLLTHCSNVCLFEDYLKSKSAGLTLIES